MPFFNRLFNRLPSRRTPASEPVARDAPTHALVPRPDTWQSPQPAHLTAALTHLHNNALRHALPHWLCHSIHALLSAGVHHSIKEAMLSEAHAAALISPAYSPDTWTDVDIQSGFSRPATSLSVSTTAARYLAAAAVVVAFAEHADDRAYLTHVSSSSNSSSASSPRHVSHVIAPHINPALISRPDPSLVTDLHRLLAIAVSPAAAHYIVAAARAALITTARGPQRYADIRRLLPAAFDAHSIGESPARFAVVAAWLCYSAVRDGHVCRMSQADISDVDILRAVIQSHTLLPTAAIPLADRLATSLTVAASPSSRGRLLPAGLPVPLTLDARRPQWSPHPRAVPVVSWRDATRGDTRGWVGPICSGGDVFDVAAAVTDGERPILTEPSDEEGDTQEALCLALSYKHDDTGVFWRLSRQRTETLCSVILALAQGRKVYLWIDRVYEMDVTSSSSATEERGEDEDATWDVRAESLEVFCRTPMVFVERDMRADCGSLWLWAERLGAVCGEGAFGNWLPLVASMDGGIAMTYASVEGDGAEGLCGLFAQRRRKEEEVVSRVARLMLRANVNSKGVSDSQDVAGMMRWACKMVLRETRGYAAKIEEGEYGTEQDWMGIHVADGNGLLSPLRALWTCNLVRSGVKEEEVKEEEGEEKMVKVRYGRQGGFGVVETQGGQDGMYCDVYGAENGKMEMSCVAPMLVVAQEMYKAFVVGTTQDDTDVQVREGDLCWRRES